MNETVYQELVDSAARRELTRAEQAQLAAYLGTHPAARALWEADHGLNRALRGLPDVPISTNFTAQVVRAAVHRGPEHRARRRPVWREWFGAWGHAWQAGAAALLVLAALLGQHQYRLHTRAELARSVATISTLTTLPNLGRMLQDFDQIRTLPAASPAADDELLSALQ